MRTTLETINAEWQRQATASLVTIEGRGDCRHMVTFYRYDRNLATALMRWWTEDPADMAAAWSEIGTLAAGLKADVAVFMMDSWVDSATAEEMASPDFVRPRDNPASTEALQGMALTREGGVPLSIEIRYHRGDHGEIVTEDPVLSPTGVFESESAVAFIEAFRSGRAADNPLTAIADACRRGHIIVYKGKTHIPPE